MSKQNTLMHTIKPCPFKVGDFVVVVDSKGNPLPEGDPHIHVIRRIRWYFNTWMVAFEGLGGYEVNYTRLVFLG